MLRSGVPGASTGDPLTAELCQGGACTVREMFRLSPVRGQSAELREKGFIENYP
jgi:hypothetical protein